jgi:hypothetical protein
MAKLIPWPTGVPGVRASFPLTRTLTSRGMPTKYPKLSLALKKILDETHLNPADRWLILKQDPHELARILKAKLSENQWIRYYNAPSKDLPRLLNQDAENLESKAKLTSILDAKRQYRRQASVPKRLHQSRHT